MCVSAGVCVCVFLQVGGSVLAGPRASPSTGALTRIFIATYGVRVQGQSMYSL